MFSVFILLTGSLILALFRNSFFYDYGVLFVIFCFSLAYIFDISSSKLYKPYLVALFMALVVRLLLLFYDVYTNNPLNIPMLGGELQSDPLGFYTNAVLFSEGYPIYYGGNFSRLIGVVFALTGTSRLWGEFIVLLFSVAVIHVVISILQEFKVCQSIAIKSVLLLGILPNFSILSVVFRRETVIAFFVTVSLFFFIKWLLGKGIFNFVFAIAFSFVASLFHSGAGLLSIPYIFVLFIYNPYIGKYTLKVKNIVLALLFFSFFVAVFFSFRDVFFSKIGDFSDLSSVATVGDRGGSSYASYVGDSSSILRIIQYTLPRYLYFMFSPFPWQWRSLADVITFLFSSFFYLYIVYKSLKQIVGSQKDRMQTVLTAVFFTSVFISVVFSWGVTNTGTAVRHRDKFISIYILMLAICENMRYQNRLNKLVNKGV